MLSPFFYLQAIWQALAQIWVNKTRSMLTTLGIVIGVWAVTSVIAARLEEGMSFMELGSAPAYRFTGDTDTGWCLAADDTIRIITR